MAQHSRSRSPCDRLLYYVTVPNSVTWLVSRISSWLDHGERTGRRDPVLVLHIHDRNCARWSGFLRSFAALGVQIRMITLER